jgi:alpha-galactosidase
MMKRMLPVRALAATLLILLVSATGATAAGPVRVYVLAGQSNMEGHGRVKADPMRNGGQGSLEHAVRNAQAGDRLTTLVDAAGAWRERDDVFITYLQRRGALRAGFGVRENETIGPELGFGVVTGDASDEPVLLIKCAWGGKSLAVDFRPPSAGKPPYSLGKETDAEVTADPQIIGRYYRETVALTKAALAEIKTLVPGSDGRYVIAGFGWHQGWNDRVTDKFNAEYESNMVHFIRDMRRDLGAPAMKFVIGETGMTGLEETDPSGLALMKAQAAAAAREEFRGNVAFVPTRSFWRPEEQSPSDQGYHWNSNGETYWLIGHAMGEAMVKLERGK